MALAPYFERIYSAVSGHLGVSHDDLTAALANTVVGVACSPSLTINDIWVAELSTNLLARLYPRMSISGPEQVDSALRDLARRINPAIEITEPAPQEMTISVGAGDSPRSLFPSASGWVARLGHSSYLGSGPANPYAAAAAAAFAAAELFRRIFLKAATEPDFALSLLNFDQTTGDSLILPSSTLGDVAFVGLGAIGNAALWALARDDKRQGHLWLVDNERLELSNIQRYVLATATDVTNEKVLFGKETLVKSQILVDTANSSLEEFADAKDGIAVPTVCISVDNIATRRNAQALLPRLIINGWTGDRALGASWHIFSRNAACLACLYHPHGQAPSQTEQAARALGLTPERGALLWLTRQPLSDDDIAAAASKLGVESTLLTPWRGKALGDLYTDVVCGAVPISLPVTGRTETVPLAHQSVLAGVLMVTELVKRTNPGLQDLSQAEPLVSWDDVLGPPPAIWRKPMAREKGCICGDEVYQNAYLKKWGEESSYDSRKRSPV